MKFDMSQYRRNALQTLNKQLFETNISLISPFKLHKN